MGESIFKHAYLKSAVERLVSVNSAILAENRKIVQSVDKKMPGTISGSGRKGKKEGKHYLATCFLLYVLVTDIPPSELLDVGGNSRAS